jgi:hypothetical protein
LDNLPPPWLPAVRWYLLDAASPRVAQIRGAGGRIGVDARGRAWLVLGGAYNGPYDTLPLLLACWGLCDDDLVPDPAGG